MPSSPRDCPSNPLQKPDPPAAKELAIAALARIYTLLHAYPTLVREIATPTLPAFATACLQLVRAAAPGEPPKAPMAVVEAATRALAALIPLYPTTLRPFAVQIRASMRTFVAPTSSDGFVVPTSLRHSARQLLILLHYTAAKSGNADEWAKLLNGFVRDAYATADQVLRSIRESRDPGSGFAPSNVSNDGEPEGGGDDSAEDLPAWSGLQSGGERLVGLLETIAHVFRCPTKLPVAVPIGILSALVSRFSVIAAPAAGTPDRAFASLINPSIGREERDELWALLPSIHTACLALLSSMVTRMGANIVPLAPEMLEDAVRMMAANRGIVQVQTITYALVRDMLPLVGPSLGRTSVDALAVVFHACCRDILEVTGHLQPEVAAASTPAAQNGSSANGSRSHRSVTAIAAANADLFLVPSSAQADKATPRREAGHHRAAESLLISILLYVPQQHVKKADRTLLDRAAILSGSKDAMVASVLHPYVDPSGRYFANTIPFLARAFPNDIEMEILRSNLRTAPHYFGNIFAATAPGEDDASDDDDASGVDGAEAVITAAAGEDAAMADQSDGGAGVAAAADNSPRGMSGFSLPAVLTKSSGLLANTAAQLGQGPLETLATAPGFEPLTLKRKLDEPASAPKRLDMGKAPEEEASSTAAPDENSGDSGDESDGSVQLEMVFDEEEDSDESGEES